MKVLVVDDDEAVWAFLCEALRDAGHEVIGPAGDGMEAITYYEKENPDLVFMDIDMPIMDGFDVIDIIRRVDPHAKIVVATGTSQKLEAAYEAGALALLRKPFRLEELERLLQQIQAVFNAHPQVRPRHLTEVLRKQLWEKAFATTHES